MRRKMSLTRLIWILPDLEAVFRLLGTLAKTEIIYPKNVRAKVAMDFTSDKYATPRTIEKMKILGAVLKLPANQDCQFRPFTSKLGQIGQIVSAV